MIVRRRYLCIARRRQQSTPSFDLLRHGLEGICNASRFCVRQFRWATIPPTPRRRRTKEDLTGGPVELSTGHPLVGYKEAIVHRSRDSNPRRTHPPHSGLLGRPLSPEQSKHVQILRCPILNLIADLWLDHLTGRRILVKAANQPLACN
jgi:hypothetical protein